jgi:hypothetical protein
MKKFDKTKVIVIVSMLFGILGYFYIMVFMSPGILEVLALIFFNFVISVSSAFLLNKEFKGIDLSEGIRKRFDEIARALDTLTPFIITLSLFYFMNR